jgi:predicted ATPase
VLQAAFHAASVSEALAQAILTKAEGNPFFLEELGRTVVEQGAERLALAVPDTIHAVLADRIDRLPPAPKALLQAAAVIGHEVTLPLLQALVGLSEEELRRGLQALQAAEFVYETRLVPVPTYTFKHVLTQEVAYQSLLHSTRAQYHRQIAQVIEERWPELAATQPELVAHHYTEAGLTEQAVAYWQRAGQQALERSANLEAVQHPSRGLELLAPLPGRPVRAQQELDLQLALGPALIAAKGNTAPEVEQTYVRARALCAQIGDTQQLLLTLRSLCRFYTNRGALPTARELGAELVRLAEQTTDPTRRLEAHDTLGNLLFYLGEYTAARTYFEQGIVLTDPAAQWALALRSGTAPGVTCLGMAAHTLWCLGYPTQAVRRGQEALALALAHAHSLAVARH